MNVLSFNIKGGENPTNRHVIRNLISSGKVDICMLQETKIQRMKNSVAQAFWESSEVTWSAKNNVGKSGGMILLWNSILFGSFLNFEGESFVGVQVSLKGLIIYFVNVYSSCVFQSKRKLCADLNKLKSYFLSDEWCVGGEFNTIKRASERKMPRSQIKHSEMVEFFILFRIWTW